MTDPVRLTRVEVAVLRDVEAGLVERDISGQHGKANKYRSTGVARLGPRRMEALFTAGLIELGPDIRIPGTRWCYTPVTITEAGRAYLATLDGATP